MAINLLPRIKAFLQPVPSPGQQPPIYSPYGAMTSPKENLIGPNVVAHLDNGTIENIVIPAMYAAWSQWGYQPSMPWYQLVNQYVGWVQTFIDKKARAVAMFPLCAYQYRNEDGRKFRASPIKARIKSLKAKEQRLWLKGQGLTRIEIPDHPSLALFHNPNPTQTYFSFMWKLATILCLDGAIGLYKVKDALGTPQRLLLLPMTWSGQFKAMPDVAGGDIIGGYRYQDGDLKQYFTPEEIVWIHLESLKSPFEGMSPIKSQMYSVKIDQAALNQQTSLFANNAMPGMALKTSYQPDPKQIADIKASLQARAGTQNTGKGVLLPFGVEPADFKWHTSRDTMIDVVYKEVRDRIGASFDVSPGMVGMTEKQNKANLDAVMENFIEQTIKPDCTLITQFLNKDYMPDFDDETELDFDMPKFEERAAELAEEQSQLDRGQITINEWREGQDRPNVPWGNAPWIQGTRQQPNVPGALEPRPQPAPVAPNGQPVKPGTPQGASSSTPATPGTPAKNPKKTKSLSVIPSSFTKAYAETQWKSFASLHSTYEPRFKKAAQTHFRQQCEEVVKRLQRHGAKIKGDVANLKGKALKEHFEKKEDFASINVPLDGDAWMKSIDPAIKEAMKAAGAQRIGSFSGDIEFDLADPRVQEWMSMHADKMVSVDETTRDSLKTILKEDYGESKPIHEIAADVRAYFDEAEGWRAANIARTETTAAVNAGDIEAVRQMDLGDDLDKAWLNEPDARDTHQQAGEDYGEGIPLDEQFKVGNDTMDAPGGGSTAEENCNCRCTLIYKKKAKESGENDE